MTTNQLNKMNAYDTIEAFLSENVDTMGLVAIPPKFAVFRAKLRDAKAAAAKQAQSLPAAIADRTEALAVAQTTALVTAGIVLSHADATNNLSLATRVRLRRSDFEAARLGQRVLLMQQIHDAATTVLPQLAEYGYTAERHAGFQAQIDAAAAAISMPRRTTGEKAAATATLRAKVREIDRFLANQLDPLMLPLEQTKPELYARYKSARAIVDRPGGRTAQPTEPAEPAKTAAAEPTPGDPQKLAA